MAGIGNYIHLSAHGYLEHGVTDDETYHQYQSQKKNIYSRSFSNRSLLSKKDKEELAATLESMMHLNSENLGLINQARQMIYGELSKEYTRKMQKINWETGNVVALKDKDEMIGQAESGLKVQDMINRIERLEKVLQKKINQGDINAQQAQTVLTQLKTEYHNTVSAIAAELQKNFGDIKKLDKKYSRQVSRYRDQLNAMIDLWAFYPPINLQKGDLFEHMIAYAPKVAEQEAFIAANRVLGKVSEQASLSSQNFDSKFITKRFSKDCIEKTTVSQGKVDVEITWNKKEAKISAKNINLSSGYWINLVSDTSFLSLLQDEDTDFVNHVLNILAFHKKPRKNEEGFNSYSQDSAQINLLKKNIIKELRLMFFYKALTGDFNNRNKANLFVINDNQTGKVRVIDMNELLLKATKRWNSLGNNMSAFKIEGVTQSFKLLKNEKLEEGPAGRISRLLADAHSRKINVALNPGVVAMFK